MPDATTKTKNVLLRLDPDLAAQLQAVAEIESRSVSDVVREAIRELLAARRKDKRFQKRLAATVAEQEQILAALRNDQQ